MKKSASILFLTCMVIIITAFFSVCFADPPGPPAGHGLTENQGPFDAFVGDGIAILYVLAVEYAFYYFFRDKILKKFFSKNFQH